jgi:hypothetical protein
VPSFVEPSVIPTVDCPSLRRVKLDDLGLITNSERWAHAHFSDKVWLHTRCLLGDIIIVVPDLATLAVVDTWHQSRFDAAG